MKRMQCVHRYRIASGLYRIASQGAMRGPASHRPHRHNQCGESASHRFSDAMPDTWLAMPMLSAGIGLTSLRVDSESDSCPDSDSEIDWSLSKFNFHRIRTSNQSRSDSEYRLEVGSPLAGLD
ncbi:hypothetical protein PGT21_003012 [Puccinia graminis f. sp. tritici]|uniref:Uncharacterized protein n=1 Tax=Puccinia graminis f. sp. tritici TaxID=56615 RepID=A0A5B0NCR3_PUCGR|nr:hypothetical protein PGT21_003012 [Puccinia graminis f. sp. tritici]